MHGWQAKEAVNKFKIDQMHCSTAGYRIHESDNFIVVALSIGETSYQDMLAIPKCSIISQRELDSIDTNAERVDCG